MTSKFHTLLRRVHAMTPEERAQARERIAAQHQQLREQGLHCEVDDREEAFAIIEERLPVLAVVCESLPAEHPNDDESSTANHQPTLRELELRAEERNRPLNEVMWELILAADEEDEGDAGIINNEVPVLPFKAT